MQDVVATGDRFRPSGIACEISGENDKLARAPRLLLSTFREPRFRDSDFGPWCVLCDRRPEAAR